MPLISLHAVRMHYGGPVLLDGVDLKLEPGRKIGMIGRNGVGKSTLLRLMAGLLEPTEGTVTRPGGARVAFQAQELEPEVGVTVYAAMQRVFAESTAREASLRDLESRIADAATDDIRAPLLRAYADLQRIQEEAGFFDVDQRIRRLLASLGIPEPMWTRTLDGMSGGERNVIGLAQVLLSDPDAMLLDEPTNHLDMDGVEWFIRFVRRARSAVVMVSHNRHLLDATVDEIWEVTGAKVKRWVGTYGDYQRQKAEAHALQERQFKVQQRLIQRIEFQARRLRDMASAYDDPGQAKRAKAMLKRVEQMDKVERPDKGDRRMATALKGAPRHGRIALTIKDFHFAYGDRVLFDKANLELEYGERVSLVGPNGSGKSTLFRAILDEGHWENPTLRIGKSTKVGEYRQLFDDLDGSASLEDWAMDQTGLDAPGARALLHRFLFTRDDLVRRVHTLSGGEKSRLQLLRLAHEQVNFLLLDEPTNHLDIESCEQLEEMLMDYEGTLLVISHDRYFLDKLVGRVVEVKDLGLVSHPKTFAEWWREREESGETVRRGALEDRHTGVHRASDEKAAAREAFEQRRAARRAEMRLRNRCRDIEREIETQEQRANALEAELEAAFGPDRDPGLGARLAADLSTTRTRLESLYDSWSEAAAELGPEEAPG